MTAMTATKKIEAQVNRLWTVGDMERKFRVTYQTLSNWRKDKALPVIVVRGAGRPAALLFEPGDIRKWARAHDMEIYE